MFKKCTDWAFQEISFFKSQPAYGRDEESRETKNEDNRLLLLANHRAMQQSEHFSI